MYILDDEDDDINLLYMRNARKNKKNKKKTDVGAEEAPTTTTTPTEQKQDTTSTQTTPSTTNNNETAPVQYISKGERERLRLQQEADEAALARTQREQEVLQIKQYDEAVALTEKSKNQQLTSSSSRNRNQASNQRFNKPTTQYQHQIDSSKSFSNDPTVQAQKQADTMNSIIHDQYLKHSLTVTSTRTSAAAGGKTESTSSNKFKNNEKFKTQWDANEDTTTLQPLDNLFGSLIIPSPSTDNPQSHTFNTTKRNFSTTINSKDTSKDFFVDSLPLRSSKKKKQAQEVVHWSKKSLEDMTEKDWRTLREDFGISQRSKDCPSPIRFWKESGLPEPILNTLDRIGFYEPTPIQRATIPIGLAQRDVLGIAQTGSGKTLAFLFPMFTFLNTLPRLNADTAPNGPYAIILAPTRVLVEQIQAEAERFGAALGIRSISLVGGRSLEQQAFALGNGIELICATPDRLFDLLDRRYIVLSQCNYIVLDEADRMLDLGFEQKIQTVMEKLPSTNLKTSVVAIGERTALNNSNNIGGINAERSTSVGGSTTSATPNPIVNNPTAMTYRHTVMFSATMPPKVEALAQQYLRNPIKVEINAGGTRVADSVEQIIEWTTPSRKQHLLPKLLSEFTGPIVIFCNRRLEVDSLISFLDKQIKSAPQYSILRKHRVISYHANKTQDQRDAALDGFRNGQFTIMVATDVVARGLDVKGVTLVVNYSMPEGEHPVQTYTHRIGRTGRAGAKGTAVSFVTEDDARIFYSLRKLLEDSDVKIPRQLLDHPASKIDPRYVAKGTDLSKLSAE